MNDELSIVRNEGSRIKKILLGLMLISGVHLSLNADVSMNSPETPEHPIVKPPIDPIRPIRRKAIVRPTLLYGKHYHTYVTTTESNCNQYIRIIRGKDERIEALIKENARLKEAVQTDLQKRLKIEYDKEMQKFEERRK